MEERGEEWDQGLAEGLLHSLCFLPLLSYGYTAPLASLGDDVSPVAAEGLEAGGGQAMQGPIEASWPTTPLGMQRVKGAEADKEDGILKVIGASVTTHVCLTSIVHAEGMCAGSAVAGARGGRGTAGRGQAQRSKRTR